MGGVVVLGVLMGAFLLAVPFLATLVWSVAWLLRGRGLRRVLQLVGRHALCYLKVVGGYLAFSLVVLPFLPLSAKQGMLNVALLAFLIGEAVLFSKQAAKLRALPAEHH